MEPMAPEVSPRSRLVTRVLVVLGIVTIAGVIAHQLNGRRAEGAPAATAPAWLLDR
jgi:hypothetical protein